jgi:hypothetical protein
LKKSKLDSLFYYTFIFLIAFPFIPQLIKSTDTQPSLIIFILLFILFGSIYRKNKLEFKINKNIYWYLFFIILVISILFLNVFIYLKFPNINRYFSFIQFMIAVFCGLFIKIDLPENWLTKILILYLIFTCLYFLTNGYIEDFLISSREMNSTDLAIIGRGARTLSPEPSFFALHLFNLYILNKLQYKNYGLNEINIRLNYILISIMLIMSLSGYGMLIFFIISFFEFPKKFIFLSILLISFTTLFISQIQSFESFRAFGLLIKFISENPLEVFQTDSSISTRFSSFNIYVNSIKDNFLLGDNFTLLEGGGIISLISGLGIVGLIFSIIIVINIFKHLKNPSFFFLFITWFTIFFISGPIGIPTFGFIIGLFLTNNFQHRI